MRTYPATLLVSAIVVCPFTVPLARFETFIYVQAFHLDGQLYPVEQPTWNSAAAGVICGSSPEAEEVTRSAGTARSTPPLSARAAATAGAIQDVVTQFFNSHTMTPKAAADKLAQAAKIR